MMDILGNVATLAIVFGVIYKLFELYVGRKERIMLIDKLPPDKLVEGKLSIGKRLMSYSGLRLGCLLLGLGIGILMGYFIVTCSMPLYTGGDIPLSIQQLFSVVCSACTLMGGGLGLLGSFLIEVWYEKKADKKTTASPEKTSESD